MKDLKQIIEDVIEEVRYAESKYPSYHSGHEGYGIIAEELDELWDEIKMKNTSYSRQYTEAKHIACTAIRHMIFASRNGVK
jgi:spermidine synthase